MFFRTNWPTAFADADAVVVAEVARLEQLAAGERLDPEKLMQDLKAVGQKRRLSAGRGRHRGPRRQRTSRAAMSFASSATAALAGSMGNCWSGWVGDSLGAPASRRRVYGQNCKRRWAAKLQNLA